MELTMTRWLALLAFLLLPSLAHAQATVVTSCGSTTLSAGTSHFVTVDTNGQSCQSGAGTGTTGCSQATAYLARATGETAHAADLTTLICGLVTDGVWSKLDALYVLAQQTQADARLNLTGTSYSLSGSATFVAYQGFSAFSAGGLDTGFNASLGPSYTLNNASLSAWAYSAPGVAKAQVGNDVNAGSSYIFASNTGSALACLVNSASNLVENTADVSGLYECERTSSTNVAAYFDGTSLGSSSIAAATMIGANFAVGDVKTGGYAASGTISEAHIGASLGSAGNLALYNRLRTYMTSVGVP